MGLRWYRQVWADKTLNKKPASYKLVMLALADFADDDTGECWPSIDSLSEMVGISDRQVQRAIGALIADGYLSVKHVHGRSKNNTYTIIDVQKGGTDDTFTHQEKVTPVSPFNAEKVTPRAEKVTRVSPDPSDPLKIQDDHLPGQFLKALFDDSNFVYRGNNFTEVAADIESKFSTEEIVRAFQSMVEYHNKQTSMGKRGITSPASYLRSILITNSNDFKSKDSTPKAKQPIGVSGNLGFSLANI